MYKTRVKKWFFLIMAIVSVGFSIYFLNLVLFGESTPGRFFVLACWIINAFNWSLMFTKFLKSPDETRGS